MADFIWRMTAIDWGWSIEDTAAKLPEVSESARLKDEGYALVSAQNAGTAVERNALKRVWDRAKTKGEVFRTSPFDSLYRRECASRQGCSQKSQIQCTALLTLSQ
jgi:hypothetical protein